MRIEFLEPRVPDRVAANHRRERRAIGRQRRRDCTGRTQPAASAAEAGPCWRYAKCCAIRPTPSRTWSAFNARCPGDVSNFIDAKKREESHRDSSDLARVPARQALDGDGLQSRVHQHVGNPGTAIPALANSLAADLIAMGARGLGTPAGALLGSVAQCSVENAVVPVLWARSRHPPRGTWDRRVLPVMAARPLPAGSKTQAMACILSRPLSSSMVFASSLTSA